MMLIKGGDITMKCGLTRENSSKRHLPSDNGCVSKYKVRKVSAYRDFLPGRGRNDKVDLQPDEEKCSSKEPNVEPSIIRTCKDKYCQRKVFSLRDFPPLCGRNAPQQTKPLVELLTSDFNLCAPTKDEEIKVLENCDSVTQKGPMEVVQALMAAPYCPQRTKKKKFINRLRAVARKTHLRATNYLIVCVPNRDFIVCLPAFGHNNDARNKVRETLCLFHANCKTQRQQEKEEEKNFELQKMATSRPLRIDLRAAKTIRRIYTKSLFLGQVPGVEVGDKFQYMVELAIVGIHCSHRGGVDSIKYNGMLVATSIIVASSDYMENSSDILIYSRRDHKLDGGNLALKNSLSTKTPVRIIRGCRDLTNSRVSTYIYDGLYVVKKCWMEKRHQGKLVSMFELRKYQGQPVVSGQSILKKYMAHKGGVRVDDISDGKEPYPIQVVNMKDTEIPPKFNYISKMMYPDWFSHIPPQGCNCKGRCSDSQNCLCAMKNGGEIPFNRNGAIVNAKPLVYECGPNCKCPPSCYNRVSQRGIRFKLEIFKTESRGWGLRCPTFIPIGSFICEYVGELLDDKEAEQRIGNDEYLFDIGHNYQDPANFTGIWEQDCFTIDAVQYGNIGRFINHSCSPNLYAQNVIYDKDDTRTPHIMLFASENIPPLQELTYHYNYSLDQVLDSHGNVKMKRCYCGTDECNGRMY